MISRLFYPLLFLLLLPGIAQAKDIILSPQGSNDQSQISGAIKTVSESGGGTVYLNSGVYDISNTITMRSNVKLTGDSEAILRVSASYQWFTGQIGVISNPDESLHDVEICGFQIDGNIGHIKREWDSTPGHDRDCEKLILIGGWSSSFGNNIKIHDLKLYNSFSDGIYIRFTNGVSIYNNVISNCQHEGFYLSCCTNILIYNNHIAGICSDCGRVENSQYGKIFDNLFFSYNGNTWGAFAHGENGLQIGDQGTAVNHGFLPTAKPITTKDIEVYNNTFADPGLKAIWLTGGENVYIHDNRFIDASGLETLGVPVGDISWNNQPALAQSEDIFSSLLNGNFFFSYFDKQVPINANVSVTVFNNSYNPYSLVFVSGEGLTGIKYEYNGGSLTHYLSINGENSDLWAGDLQHRGNALYLNGSFDASKLQVTCYNPQGYCKITNFNITEVADDSAKTVFNPQLWAFVGTLTILGFSIYRNFRRIVTKW